MEQKQFPQRRFTVIFDIGVRIPVDNFRIGPVTVGRKPPVLVARDGELQVDVEEPYVKHHRSTYEFTTGSYYWMSVWSSSPWAASEEVEHTVDPFVSAVLSYQAGFEVLTRLAAVHVEDEPPPLLSPSIRKSSSVEYEVPALNMLYNTLADDECLRRAAGALRRGRHLMSVRDEPARPALIDMGLFQVFQCLEALATDKRHHTKDGAGIEAGPAKRAQIIDKLRIKLSDDDQTVAVQAIESAKQQLFQLDGYTLQRMIKSLAAWLQLDRAWLSGATKLAKARNEHLGHNGKFLDESLRQNLFEGQPNQTPAVQVAEDCLMAFARRISTASDQPGTSRGSALIHPVENPGPVLDWSTSSIRIDAHEDPRLMQSLWDQVVLQQTVQGIAASGATRNQIPNAQ